jgi:hypothetical protein
VCLRAGRIPCDGRPARARERLLADLIAAGPGWAAARIRPAAILRSE